MKQHTPGVEQHFYFPFQFYAYLSWYTFISQSTHLNSRFSSTRSVGNLKRKCLASVQSQEQNNEPRSRGTSDEATRNWVDMFFLKKLCDIILFLLHVTLENDTLPIS